MAGIAIAAGVLSKYSFLVFFPAAAAVLLAVLWIRGRRNASPIRPMFLVCGIVALIIASAKAGLVFAFFMHLLYSHKLTWLFALGALFWLGILMGLSMSDYLTRQDPSQEHGRAAPLSISHWPV